MTSIKKSTYRQKMYIGIAKLYKKNFLWQSGRYWKITINAGFTVDDRRGTNYKLKSIVNIHWTQREVRWTFCYCFSVLDSAGNSKLSRPIGPRHIIQSSAWEPGHWSSKWNLSCENIDQCQWVILSLNHLVARNHIKQKICNNFQ